MTIDTSLLKASVNLLYFNIVSFISFITNSLIMKGVYACLALTLQIVHSFV